MTISNTLATALSGLTAASRAAELVSSNIANASTPGYARRELQLASRVVGSSGQGVQVVGVRRAENAVVIADRRLAQAAQGDSDARTAFYQKLEKAVGTPDLAYSLNGRISAFDTALTEAISHPESEARLTSVLTAARGLASTLVTTGKEIQAARLAADAEIDTQVNLLNDNLLKVSDLNVQIRRGHGLGQDVSSLIDLRQQTVDAISSIVPLRQVDQADGSIKLYTSAGATLLDGAPGLPVHFGFTRTQVIVPEMTQASGGLSGLTLNGAPIPTSGSGAIILGGSLAAEFAVRDELGTEAQAQLDAVTRDLIERFQDSGLDATRLPGDAGLFTDAGAAFDPVNEIGLAQRIKVNAQADPAQGGGVWRLRDGLGATTQALTGNNSLLRDMRAALIADRAPASGDFIGGARSASVLASDFLSQIAGNRLSAEGDSAFTAAKLDTYQQMEAQDGVDTDQEMQSLLQIEQAYAANAKVIKTVEEMLNRLMEI
ncbi:flagellar hook-associated protein FlgK [Stagnihabitans tardus]|uniref:Flagellar hook-associated protein 1 n=1 Tax=Stagnihabitans tardus TaxID=2699202 RepID=A0AAE4YET1_9RHOB|nr:flagellar hook-associated protein FlgK [Stagnihabitans tardus]NBZ88380.1 flagellar hook-associated protein FlgK [Stagnihabitans tardus]